MVWNRWVLWGNRSFPHKLSQPHHNPSEYSYETSDRIHSGVRCRSSRKCGRGVELASLSRHLQRDHLDELHRHRNLFQGGPLRRWIQGWQAARARHLYHCQWGQIRRWIQVWQIKRARGEFKDGKWHGQGTYTYGSKSKWAGDKYVGEWKDGNKHGQGTYTYADGDKYVGELKDGKRHGQGTLYYLADNQFKGDIYVGVNSRMASGTGKAPIPMAAKVNGQGTNTSVNSKMAISTGKAPLPMPMDE